MSDDRQALIERLRAYRRDPVLYVNEVLRAKPDEDQAAILRAVAVPGSRVSVRSGKGVGKTTTLAWAVLWFVNMHTDCKVPCTAPSSTQLFDNLWAEIGKWRSRMAPSFASEIRQLSDRMEIIGFEKTRFAVARTARKESPESLQGYHATNLMFCVDEASGIPEEIGEVIEGAMSTPGARCFLISNPTRNDGFFYDTHHKARAHWVTFVLNAERSPHVSQEECRRKAERWRRDSNVYRVGVLGEFPRQSDDTLIPLDWVTSAFERDIVTPVVGFKRVAGVDVARFGDDASAMAIRCGPVMTHLEQWRGNDLMQTTGRIALAYRERKLFDIVYVDVIGMGGGVVDRLKELGVPVVGVNVAESPAMKSRYRRLRDELWFTVREWFQAKGCRLNPKLLEANPDSGERIGEDLTAELTTMRYHPPDSEGKIKVWSKQELKKAGFASPNCADALCLCFASGSGKIASGVVRQVVVNKNFAW